MVAASIYLIAGTSPNLIQLFDPRQLPQPQLRTLTLKPKLPTLPILGAYEETLVFCMIEEVHLLPPLLVHVVW